MKFLIRKYSIYFVAVVITCFGTASCKKLLEIPPNPSDKITSGQAFADSSNALHVMAGIYNSFEIVDNGSAFGFYNGGIGFYTGLSADELITKDIFYQQFQIPFYINSLLPATYYVAYMWSSAYKTIYQVNASLEGVAASTGLSASLKQQLTGELKLVRAFTYFNLVNLYGGVPLVTSTDFGVNARLPRATVEEAYTLIITDLEDAVSKLVPDYPSPGRARPNLYTVKALLAKVYLYREDWQKAATLSGDVIDAGLYALETDLNNLFLNGSMEAIWQYPGTEAGSAQTNEGYHYVPYPGEDPSFELTPELTNAFETDDQRKVFWIAEHIVNGSPVFAPYKYKNKDNSTNPTVEDYMMLRLAEQYLIRAEARAQLDQSSDALDDLNAIRQRAGLPDLSFTDQETLLADILQERRVELFCEWGNRWFDLKRMDKANTVLGTKPNWEPTDVLYPIPLPEIQANPFLVQNPGY